jgi:uncharacterized caspase-like protein
MFSPVRAVAGISRPEIYVLSVGINQYPAQSGFSDRGFAEADATDLAPALAKLAAVDPLRQTIHIVTLVGAQATADAIRSAMQQIAANAIANDIFILTFNGMGTCKATDTDFEFAAYDTVLRPDGTIENGLSAGELGGLLGKVPADERFVILDTCRAQKAVDDLLSALRRNRNELLKELGLMAMDSSGHEAAGAKHGPLAATILDGLGGTANFGSGEPVTWDELVNYVTSRLPGVVRDRTARPWAGAEPAGKSDAPQRLFVLSIGINRYPASGRFHSLQLAEADASSVSKAFSNNKQLAIPEVIVRQLLGDQATLDGIRTAMQEIAKDAQPEDALLFYIADDSDEIGGDFIFAASDTLADLKVERGLRASDLATLLLQIPAKRQMIVLDTSDSLLAADAIRAALEPKGSFDLSTIKRQVAIFASRGDEPEIAKLGHGLLTYCLLEGINGAADADHSGLVTEARLEGYMTWKLPEVAKQLSGANTHFYSYSTLDDLVLFRSSKTVAVAPTRGVDVEEAEAPAATDLGRDYALIVASDHYSEGWRTLANPIYDAKALRDELEKDYGYDPKRITELYNPKKADVVSTIKLLIQQKFGANDRLLVYFAGHGIRNPFDGYLAFSDSRAPDQDDSYDTLLPFSSLRNALDVIPVPHILLVMDVCYGGIFDATTSFHSILGGTADHPASRDQLVLRALKARSRIYITSGDENHQVSDGEPGGHSPFSKALLKELEQKGGKERLLDVATLYSSLRSLPMEPRAGYFDIGGAERNADFVLIPTSTTLP